MYKDAAFLSHSVNIELILTQNYQLRNKLKAVRPGEIVEVTGMMLELNTPLRVKNTKGSNVPLQDFEFNNNRLTGLTAAYVFDNRSRFPDLKSSEATALGLTWDNRDTEKCRLYLSAVTGTEYFYEQFSFWPLICVIRKLQLGKITPELVLKAAKIRNNNGERLSHEFKRNIDVVTRLWKYFPGSESSDLALLFATASEEIKRVFIDG